MIKLRHRINCQSFFNFCEIQQIYQNSAAHGKLWALFMSYHGNREKRDKLTSRGWCWKQYCHHYRGGIKM